MRKKKKFSPFVIPFIISILILVLLVLFLDPTKLISLSIFSFSPVVLFLTVSFVTIFTGMTLLLCNIRRGVLIALCIVIILILKHADFASPLFILLTVGIFVLLEFLLPHQLRKKKPIEH